MTDNRFEPTASSGQMVTTYSLWNSFRNCRRACYWRYFRQIVPLEKAHTLYFGSLIHNCLELWYTTMDLPKVLAYIDASLPNRIHNDREQFDWHLATAMMTGYARQYPKEKFEVIALEKKFEGKIINPVSRASSRSFVLAGKVDGIVKQGDKYYLLEHKTASQIDASYLERLWTDFQITLYAWYLEQELNIRISGIFYNVLVKAKLKQSKGETEAEFEERRAALIAKSKSGRSSAKRKMPESDEAFQKRLAAKYEDPQMFHREPLVISRDQFDVLRSELWELSQALLDARRRNQWYQNTSYCFNFNRPCAYFQLCRSDGAQHVIDNLYEFKPPHEELLSSPVIESAPSF